MSGANKKDPYSILKRPVITEKSTEQRDSLNQLVFEVRRDANKIEIGQAVTDVFNVPVLRVNTLIIHGKPKRRGRFLGTRPNWKKAIVTLAEGATVDFFEAV
jgi:large subunit ribosomal protein L23